MTKKTPDEKKKPLWRKVLDGAAVVVFVVGAVSAIVTGWQDGAKDEHDDDDLDDDLDDEDDEDDE